MINLAHPNYKLSGDTGNISRYEKMLITPCTVKLKPLLPSCIFKMKTESTIKYIKKAQARKILPKTKVGIIARYLLYS